MYFVYCDLFYICCSVFCILWCIFIYITVEINQLLFADDTALVADPEEKLCRMVSEFGSVCERIKLRVNVGKSKVMRCSRYGNGD